MDILISVAAKIAELSVEPIGRQVGYLLCYRNHFKELNDRVEKLQTTKERIDHQVEAERRNGREIEGDVLRWQGSVIEILEEAQQLCEDSGEANVGCSKCSFPNLKSRHQRSRKAKKMAKTIGEMKGKGNFDQGVGYVPPLDTINNFSTTRGSDQLESRNLLKKDVVSFLKDPKIKKIGVYGISGVGKTTLVKEVVKEVKDEKLFDAVVMVTISQRNLEKIQDEIAEQLGLRLEERMSPRGRANRLWERIKKEKTILIILDDLWEKLDLEMLGIPSLDTWGQVNSEKLGVPLKDDYKGCKLLLTSRNRDILEKNDSRENFPLQLLNGEESWRLFEAMVGEVKDAQFQTIATQVAQRCAGLPVFIVTIAKSLKDKGFYYWKDTLNNLKRVDNKDMQETIVAALEFNLNRLEDEVKKVFLLCGVHGTFMFITDLLKYVIGLGIFECINTLDDARNRLYRRIDELKASCLLVDVDARSEMIKMHDRVCEVAALIASKYAFSKVNTTLQDWPRKDIPERCTHIILAGCCIQKLPERLDCPYLTFLHINSTDNRTLEIPDSFFEGMQKLEALDLTGLIISSLPISLRYLTKLKTLCLDSCSLKDMTRIGTLINLEILSLIYSSMEEFPSEIEQLTRLRMLDLSHARIGTTLPNILCKLTKIEELYMGNATIKWEVESSSKRKRNVSLAKLGYLTSLTALEIKIREAWLLPKDIPFQELERYKVVIGDEWGWSYNKETSRLLKVKLDTSIQGEQGIKTLMKKAEDLYLDKISGISNVLFELNGEGFPSLKLLHIQNNGEIQHIINSMQRNQTPVLFPKLETLILDNLNNLVKICHGPFRDKSFGQLKVIRVNSCDQLIYLFHASMVKHFSHLVEIEVSECNSMTKIVSIENVGGNKTIDDNIEFLSLCSLTLQHLPTIDHFCSHELTSPLRTQQNSLQASIPTSFFSAKVKFSNLETLKLSSVNLKTIWDENQSSTPCLIQNLANLTVEDCSGLKYLFSSSMIGRLANLKQVEISKCDTMEEIIVAEEKYGAALAEALFPKLEAVIIKDMRNLKTIWHPVLASDSLASFKTLKVKNCEKIEKIFPEYMNGAFATLETLKVKGCMSVEEIFELGDNAGDTTQLKYITLLRLPQLKQIWRRASQSSLRYKNLQVVRVEDCGDLEYLLPSSIAKRLPQLEAITIKNAEKMKEIVSKREEPLDNPVKFEFNHLTSMVLWNLQDLQGFCVGNHSLSCSSLEELDVYNCEKLNLFRIQGTSNQGKLSDDSILHVSMQQPLFIFEKVAFHSMERLEQSRYPELGGDVKHGMFGNLKVLVVRKCDFLSKVLLPLNLLKAMSNLEKLEVSECDSLEALIELPNMNERNIMERVTIHLKRIILSGLPELKHIWKRNSQEIVNFEKISSDNSQGLHTSKIQGFRKTTEVDIHYQQHTYSTGQVLLPKLETVIIEGLQNLEAIWHPVLTPDSMGNFETLKVKNCQKIQHIFPIYMHGAFATLETLKVKDCNSVREIFRFGDIAMRNGDDTTRLKNITLLRLPKLKQIWSKDPQSSLCFKSLQVVRVESCGDLEYLFPFSIAENLPLLEAITIKNAAKMKEIVSEREEPLDNPVKFEFNQLTSMVLWNLQDLKGFCAGNHSLSCSSLEELDVCNCQKLKLFKVQSPSSKRSLSDGNIQFSVQEPPFTLGKVAFSSLNHLELSEYLGLKELWYSQVGQEKFCNLKHLVVRKCTFLSNVIFSSNSLQLLNTLEELEVSECDSLEAISDVKVLDDKAKESKDVSRLNKLTLSRLPNLKRIWNKEAGEIISFGNLQTVKVDKCPNLKYVFSSSLCKDLRQLEELCIESCGVEQIVANEEGLEELKFNFPRLMTLDLINLTQLTNFYPKRYALECPSLKWLNIRGCEKLQIFAFDYLNSQRLIGGGIDLQIKQALFDIEKVSQNLEELPLNEKDTRRILNGNYEKNLFQSIKRLRLQYFQETPIKFLNDLIQKFPAITTLQARCSSFETLFPSKEIGCCCIDSPTQIKTLWLFQLEQLEQIWNDDDSASHPLVQNLEYLYVVECSRIIRLAPPSASFKNLTSLEVKDCNGLMYFMTSCTAKSLVHLTSLQVSNCGMLEEVVMMNEGESEEEITFESLMFLELTCLSSLKSFYSGKQTFIFPFLWILKVIGCQKMQNFSSGVIIAPFVKSVKVENGKERWKKDLNTTINQLFIDKATRGGIEDDKKESSSSQTHQKSAGKNRALDTKEHEAESKVEEIVDLGKQEIHKLPIPHIGVNSEIIEIPLDQASQNTLSITKVESYDAQNILSPSTVYDTGSNTSAIRTEEMNETIQTPFAENGESTLTQTSVQETALRIQDETIEKPLVQATHQVTLSPSIVRHTDGISNQEMYETLENALVPVAENVVSSSVVDSTALQNQDMYDISVERPQSTKIAPSTATVYDADGSQDLQLYPGENLLVQDTTSITSDDEKNIGTKEMHETIQRPLVQNDDDVLISASVHRDFVIGTHGTNESTDKPFVRATQNTWDITIIQEKEESHDLDIHLSKNLFYQTTVSMATKYKETVGTQETYESKRRFSVLDAQNLSSPIMACDTAFGTEEIHDTIDKSLIQTDQDAEKLATAQNTEESCDSHIVAQKIRGTIKKSSIPAAQDISNATLIPESAIDPSPSQAAEPMMSSIQKSNIYRNYNGMIDIPEQNMPYLEAGVKLHPQVLDWLNTKRQRVFASSFFSLFAEVTRILRTTRKVDLKEDDRNYIRECCTALQGVGFDDSWISYVHGCIEECGDGEDLKRKVEEAEGHASNLKAQLESINKELASVEESLVLLRDKTSRLHDFIES